MNMNAVGIVVSKCKSMATILCPRGEVVAKPSVVHHLSNDIHALADWIKSLEGKFRKQISVLL